MMQRVVVIGANGQLGTDIVKKLNEWNAKSISTPSNTEFHVIPLTHGDIEICDHNKTREMLSELKPDVVINTAAYHRVDDCEDEPEKAFQVNAFAVRNLAMICKDLNVVLVYMSTDYVFGGDRNRRTPYTENDSPAPLSVYGASKLVGEYFVRNICPKHFVIRSSGLFGLAGSSGKGGNFVETMLRLAREGKTIRVVNDQILSPTFTEELAAKIVQLLTTNYYGFYHITNTGECSWYEFAKSIFELANLSPNLSPVTTEEFGARENRPTYSTLANTRLTSIGLDDMRHWREALVSYLRARENFNKINKK